MCENSPNCHICLLRQFFMEWLSIGDQKKFAQSGHPCGAEGVFIKCIMISKMPTLRGKLQK
jgi:hypothetical protein